MQVKPERGGNFMDFIQFLNFSTEDEKILFLCTLPVRFIRDVEQPIAYVYGPAGSGKTTLLKMTKDLIDPSVGGISIPVRNPDDILPLLNKTWIFANDNISKISDEMSDFLCTLATGGESSRRKLYSDGDVHTFNVKNPAYLTGINVEASNSDLLSRTILFKTEAVIDGKRLSGTDLQRKYEEMKPKLIGGIFDVLVKAIQIRPTLECKTNFRMQDFALWGAACAEALGIGADRYTQALDTAMRHRAFDAIYSSNAGRLLLDFLEEAESFEGSATELLAKLREHRNKSEYYDGDIIANSPNGLSKKLRQLENSLLEVGIRLDFDNRVADKRIIKITSEVDGVTKAEGDF
jgi:energy-coupling factor transporter ATP-binding protein EcfA2